MSILTFFESIGTDLQAQTSGFLTSFVTTDIGKMAVDAVNYAERAAEGDDAKRDAAKTQLLNDLGDASAALIAEGTSALNFIIETALQAVTAGVVAAAV